MKAFFLASPVIISCLAVFGCENRNAQFNLTLAGVLSIEKSRRGAIFAQDGAPGPYKKEGVVVGNVNTGGFIQAGEGVGRARISWPATQGHFYEGTAYLNATNGVFVVVRKVPAP